MICECVCGGWCTNASWFVVVTFDWWLYLVLCGRCYVLVVLWYCVVGPGFWVLTFWVFGCFSGDFVVMFCGFSLLGCGFIVVGLLLRCTLGC